MGGKFKSILKKIFFVNNITYCNIVTTQDKDKLCDKVFVITGGGTGIGKEIAKSAVKNGAKAIIVGRREEKLKQVADELGDKCGYYVSDISMIAYDIFFENLEDIFGMPITNLINNAGIYLDKPWCEYNEQDFSETININLKSSFFLAQQYIVYCKKKSVEGNIVFISSNRGLYGDTGPYGISKSGINSIVQGFAREHADIHIRINAVAPGMTASDINHVDIEGNVYAEYLRGKRIILPQEIAEVVCFLASEISACVNGAVIPCDNGHYLR